MRSSVMLLLILGLLVPIVHAQSNDDRRTRRRDFVDGILRTLVESQMQGHGPAPAAHLPPARPGTQNAQLVEVTRSLEGFSQASAGLIVALRHEERYSSAIRPLLGDAIRIKAGCDVILQKTRYTRDEKQLTSDVQTLDRQWRVLSHRLAQLSNLGATTVAHVKRLDQYDQHLCQLLKVAPQFDRGELLELTAALRTNLANLLDDVAWDVPESGTRDALLAEGRKLQVQVDQVLDALVNGTRVDDVAAPYKTVYNQWRPFAAKLRSFESDSLARNLVRIDQINRGMHELLWIEQPMDRSAVAYFAASVERRFDRLCDDVPINVLLSMPRPQDATAAVVEFDKLCHSFAQTAAGNAAHGDLLWDFRLLEVQWQDAAKQFAAVDSAAIASHLARIDDGLGAIRESLNIRPVLDRNMAVELADSLDETAAALDRNLRSYLARNTRYSSQVKSQIAARSRAFHDATHRLHESLSGGGSEGQLRQRSLEAAEAWKQLAAQFGHLTEQNRASLSRAQEQIVQQLVKLQLMLAY